VTADYDPLALPAVYFEGLPTGVPNNLPSQPKPVEDMSAGADLTGVDGNVTEAQGAEVRVANRQPGDYASYGPDLTAEGPCTQQPAVCGSREAPVSANCEQTVFAKLKDGERFRFQTDRDVIYVRHGRYYTIGDSLGRHRCRLNTTVYPNATLGTLNRTALSRAG
jgi:hypothetical protein